MVKQKKSAALSRSMLHNRNIHIGNENHSKVQFIEKYKSTSNQLIIKKIENKLASKNW